MTDDVPTRWSGCQGGLARQARLTPTFLMCADVGLTGGFREPEVAMIDGANSGPVLGRVFLTGAVT